jgi:hypothetical protein
MESGLMPRKKNRNLFDPDQAMPIDNSPPLFFQKVRKISLLDVPKLYRWLPKESEMRGPTTDYQIGEFPEFRCEVTFYADPKKHKAYLYSRLIGQIGWMRVSLLVSGSNDSANFILCSAFNRWGEPIEFTQLESFFDSAKVNAAIETIDTSIQDRLEREIRYHYELSLAYLTQEDSVESCNLVSEIETELEKTGALVEEKLRQTNQKIREIERRHNNDPDQLAELKHLRIEQRQELLRAETEKSKALNQMREAKYQKLKQNKVINLFTLEWFVTRKHT